MRTADIFNAFKAHTTLEYLLENTYIFATAGGKIIVNKGVNIVLTSFILLKLKYHEN